MSDLLMDWFFHLDNHLAALAASHGTWLSRMAETTYSFPSGHAMSTMAAVTALCVLLGPTRWRWPVLGVGARLLLDHRQRRAGGRGATSPKTA